MKKLDNVERKQGKCVICGDTAVTKDGNCFYCNWKGNTGKGKLLREIIKEENKRRD